MLTLYSMFQFKVRLTQSAGTKLNFNSLTQLEKSERVCGASQVICSMIDQAENYAPDNID